MRKRGGRTTPALSGGIESLEGRSLLSGAVAAGALPQGAAEVASKAAHKAATVTSLAVGAGTLGMPITLSVTVRAAASAGSPTGTVTFTEHGKLIGTLALSPTASTGGKFATGAASATLASQPGGPSEFFGKHAILATFNPAGAFSKSTATRAFTVGQPAYTTLAGGVKVATIVPGSGAAIQSGQAAGVLYTGYLASNGQVFDDSARHGGTPFTFPVGAGQVVPGFDAGTLGMQVGETRIVMIPAAQGYGASGSGSIPANANLVFVLTLTSIG